MAPQTIIETLVAIVLHGCVVAAVVTTPTTATTTLTTPVAVATSMRVWWSRVGLGLVLGCRVGRVVSCV